MGFFTSRANRAAAAQDAAVAAQDAAIVDFWAWWGDGGAAATAHAFDSRGKDVEALQRVGEELGARARAIGLGFESGEGRAARHVLVLTPEGAADAADVADRWLAAAPPADDAFEFDNRRRAAADPTTVGIDYDGHRFDLVDLVMLAQPDGTKVHVAVWHPAFADVERPVAGNVAFLMLDALLGERAVEERIGAIRFDLDPADRGRPFVELRDLIA
ncbi:hypothetical protein C8046_14770 [Serinibacter arcticus]|uniref:Uncharacterized protein n=1 Tax=Serinibacter arcticus TaxID=1655435 RepID=A0A2U1ZXR0_9MICO|nr:hypothetical protein [Serinibacter arcticus]PWD51723.1 hypothetical protein C8046_14770 [Serinibacter arcticus]